MNMKNGDELYSMIFEEKREKEREKGKGEWEITEELNGLDSFNILWEYNKNVE